MSRPVTASQIVLSNHGLRRAGGIEAYLATLVRGLHERGIRPTVVAKRFDPTMAEAAWVDAVSPFMFGVPGKLRDRWFDFQLRRLKARHGWFPLIALNQTAAADIAICGSNHPAHLAAMQQTRLRMSDRWKIGLERQHLGNSRVIVAHSQLLADQVQQHYRIDRGKIVVAYPPVDGKRFAPVSAQRRIELRQQLGLPLDRPVFLLVSTGHARKGLDIAVRAVSRASTNGLLVMVGRPPDIEAPNLRYLGYRSDIEDIYRAVDATLLPSRYEPFGLVGVESVLCGTPVLIERRVGCAEVMLPPAAMPFDLADERSLAAAIDLASQRWQADAAAHRRTAGSAGLRPVGAGAPRRVARLGRQAARRTRSTRRALKQRHDLGQHPVRAEALAGTRCGCRGGRRSRRGHTAHNHRRHATGLASGSIVRRHAGRGRARHRATPRAGWPHDPAATVPRQSVASVRTR